MYETLSIKKFFMFVWTRTVKEEILRGFKDNESFIWKCYRIVQDVTVPETLNQRGVWGGDLHPKEIQRISDTKSGAEKRPRVERWNERRHCK